MIEVEEMGEPKIFWDYFLQITKIPRCSGKEEKIREYIKSEAEKLGFPCKIDNVGNLLVSIPIQNSDENLKKVILQAHLDIVCEKNDNIEHDFSKDPLKLKIEEINNRKWITADGTTLGGDNGVGIAYCLTLMKLINLGKLRFDNLVLNLLFTVNEEGGLIGAFNVRKEFVNGNFLINLDSEEDNRFTIGCAGGITTHGYLDLGYLDIKEIIKDPKAYKIIISGLLGGHSGVDIHKGRGNAIKILTKILWRLNKEYFLEIHSLLGGNLHNAIPREAKAVFFIDRNEENEVNQLINDIKEEIEIYYKEKEPDLNIILKKDLKLKDTRIFTPKIKEDLLNLLYAIPHGPIKYHQINRELVHTSTNLAAIRVEENRMEILTSQRSLENITRREMYESIEALFRLSNLDMNVEYTQKYPGWKPNFDSKILQIAKDAYIALFESEPIIQTIHAGLECGIIKEALEETEMISLGPAIKDAHSPDERLDIKSVRKIWKLLKKILKELNEKK